MPNLGFLPTRASFMLDFVVVAMVAVSVILAISIYLVRQRRLFHVHRWIQTTLVVILAITIVAFEIDIQFATPHWTEMAKESPLYESGWVGRLLGLHLLFAIPTPFVWLYVLVSALRGMGSDYSNLDVRRRHRWQGWLSAILMWGTAATGWIFYWASFVAR